VTSWNTERAGPWNRRPNHALIGGGLAFIPGRTLTVFHVQAVAEHVCRLVVKQYAQNLIVESRVFSLRSAAAAQQFLDIEDGIGLAAHFIKDQKRVAWLRTRSNRRAFSIATASGWPWSVRTLC